MHAYNVLWENSPPLCPLLSLSPLFMIPLPKYLPLPLPEYKIEVLTLRMRKKCDISLSQSSLCHLRWWFLIPSIFLQMTQFHSSLWLKNSIVVIYHILFMHSSVDGHVGWILNLAIVNSVAKNIYVQVCLLYMQTCILQIYAQERDNRIMQKFHF
jgi:hypothetical protein